MEVALGPGNIVLDGYPPPKKNGAQHPKFWPMYCGQTAAWIKMPRPTPVPSATLCYMETQIPLKRGTSVPKFPAHVCCDQTAGWIKMPLDIEAGLGPGHIVLDGTNPKGAQPAPQFRPMSVVAKRMDGSKCHLVGR